MYISSADWKNFINGLSKINKGAADAVIKYVQKNGFSDKDALVGYAYDVVNTFGIASASLAATMYDQVAELEGKFFEPAELAATPDYGEVAKTVYGTLKRSQNPDELGGAVSRLVKRTGQDTLLNNAIRDKAEFAWIPSGDTCSFCIALASRGWQQISKKALKNGHAEHIHSNCDCSYMIRHSDDVDVAGYNPDKYLAVYEGADGNTPTEKINSMRRMRYADRKDVINAQKRAAYAERMGTLDTYRKTKNTGAFSEFEELMTAKHVNSIAADMDLIVTDAKYKIDRNEEMIGKNIYGHASDDGKTVTLYPSAFIDREQLVKTIGHENIHLKQVRENGKVKTQKELIAREREARASEEGWWQEYVKRTGYRPES